MVSVEKPPAPALRDPVWHHLGVKRGELNLARTLQSAQSFRWKRSSNGDAWVGVHSNTIIVLKETDDDILFQFHPAENRDSAAIKSSLTDYFRLHLNLQELYQLWGGEATTPHCVAGRSKVGELQLAFRKTGKVLKGLRLLRQDPTECLFAFICSQNTNVARIVTMVDTLCTTYGTLIGNFEGEPYFAFPSVEALASSSEPQLRELGFGYRAKFIPRAAQQVRDKGSGWLESLRQRPLEEVRAALTELHGVGPKVADCVALGSLDKLDAIPVDTHVWQIAQRYLPALRNKTPNPKFHPQIAAFFKAQLGERCGWAHSVLFAGELRSFQSEFERTDPEEAKEEVKPNDKEHEDPKRKGDSNARGQSKKLKQEV